MAIGLLQQTLYNASMQVTIGVLTVLGACGVNEREDLINNAAVRALGEAGYTSIVTRTVTDEFTTLKNAIVEFCDTCDIVFTVGGVGFAECDITPEVTATVIERQANGIADLIRSDMHRHMETSHMNRGIAGIRGRSLIINLPGTAETVKEGIQTVSLLMRPMISALQGQTRIAHAG